MFQCLLNFTIVVIGSRNEAHYSFTYCSNWDEWRSLRTKANKQIVPRKILEFTPQIYDVSGDAMDYIRANRGLDNTVNDVLALLMDWSFVGDSSFA